MSTQTRTNDPPARQATDESRSEDATRYLCAGAHLDEAFARTVLDEFLTDTPRAVAPSYGVDIAAVVRHCLAAQRRRLIRDAAICVVFIGWFIADPFGAALVAGIALNLRVIWLLAARPQRAQTRLRRLLGRIPRPIRIVLAAFPVIQLTGFVLTGLVLVLGAPSATGDAAGAGIGVGWLGLAAVLWAIVFAELLMTHLTLVTQLRRSGFDPRRGAGEEPASARVRTQMLGRIQDGNITVYSDDRYLPFVGAGDQARTWSFALEIDPAGTVEPTEPTEPHVSLPFTIADLNAHVSSRLGALGDRVVADPERLHGLTVSDHVFADGRAVHGDPVLLPDRHGPPADSVPDEYVRALMARPTGAVRHCLAVQVRSWSGEVVVSVFLHFATDGRMLYLEATGFELLPIRSDYHVVDTLLPQVTAVTVLGLMRRAAASAGLAVAHAPFGAGETIWAPVRRSRREAAAQTAIRQSLGFDYGALVSIRELAASTYYHSYFQQLDAAKHIKIVERRVLKAVLEFLESRGIDTTEYRQQQMQVINANMVVTGGTVNADNIAAGTHAKAGNTQAPPAAAAKS